MKHIILLFLVILPVIVKASDFSAVAPSGQTLYYCYDGNGGVVVTYQNYPYGNLYSVGTKPSGVLVIPESVVNNGNTYAVTSIGNHAFDSCTGLTSVTIPNSVTSIGYDAFYNCSGLTSVTIGNSVTSIPDLAFYNCSGLTSVIIPNSVTIIGSCAFQNCSGLTSVIIPNSVTSIQDHAFQNCSGLTGVTIPSSVTSIGNGAFMNCSGLTHVFFDADSCISMGVYNRDFVFLGCNNLRTLIVGENVKIIPSYAFHGCSGLSNVTIGKSVRHIGHESFYGCANVDTLRYYARNLVTDSWWSDTYNSHYLYVGFSSMQHLQKVVIGDSVERIPDGLFYNTPLVGEIVIPANVVYIGLYSFRKWNHATSLKLYPQNPPRITSATFGYALDSIPIYIPCGATINYFVADYWRNHSTYIEYTGDSVFVESADLTQGTAAIVQRNSCGNNTAIIQATGNTYYHFDHWNDGNTSNLRYVPVTQDTSFTAFFSLNLASVSVGCNDTSMGHVSGSGNFIWDSLFTITATPNYGYHFVQWNDGSTQASRQVSVRQNTSYTAMFAPNIYNIVLMRNYAQRGTVEGAGAFNYNTQHQISATPAAGYIFDQWTDGNTDNPRLITLTQDTVFIANFIQSNYNVVTNCNANQGIVSGGGSYFYSTTAILQAIPNAHYHFTQWSDGVTVNPRSVMVTKDTMFTALFALDSVSLTLQVNSSVMGSVSGAGHYVYNSQPYIYAEANYGYHFARWDDGTSANPRRVVLTQDTTFGAEFEANNYHVLLNSNIPSCATAGSGTYGYNTIANISASAAAHHHFERWSDGSYNNPRSLLVSSDTMLTAIFAVDSHNVQVRINDLSMGSVSGAGRYAYNSQMLLTAMPNNHYHFVGWGDGVASATRQLTVVRDTTIDATFAIDQHVLSAFSSDTTMGTVEGGGQYDYGTTVTITATPKQHYHFLYWSDGVSSNPRVMEVTSNLSVIAYFAEDTRYTVAVTCNDPDMGSVAGAGSYYYGDNVTLTATANDHYHFAQWSDGNTQNPRIVQVLADATYSAIFEPDMYMLTLSANDNSKGAVYGAGEYAYGSSVTITAQAFEGYRFITWSDGDTHSVRVLTIMGDVNLRAEFGNAVGISGIEYDYSVRTANMQITINGVAGRKVEVYDISGRRIAYIDRSNDTEFIAVPARGVYLVKVGDTPARKVVVM